MTNTRQNKQSFSSSDSHLGRKEESKDINEEDGDDISPLVPPPKLPSYLAEAFGDLYQEDGLVVLGRGMGLLSLMAAFARFYSDTKDGYLSFQESESKQANRPPLVFVLGLKEKERSSLIETLESWGTPHEFLPTQITNESGQGKDREAIYQKGGVFLITSRILIVDLLTRVADPKQIEGLLVAHAENVNDQSTEAFIIRIYRTQKLILSSTTHFNSGFVKAFSDNPAALMNGFGKVDKILKALFIRRLYLYPRFHASVQRELENPLKQPKVDEIRQPLTPRMKDIQHAIAAAVQACVRELKKQTPHLQGLQLNLTVENCISQNFDSMISRQLENEWHRIKPNTKQLVHDLRTLRTLFPYLINYDSIHFWKLLQNLKSMSTQSRYPSMWLFTHAADLLYQKAKERVYRIEIPTKTKSNPRPIGKIQPILEENPKWKLLNEVLSEIRQDYETRKANSNFSDDSYSPFQSRGGTDILILVKEQRTLLTLQSYLSQGKIRLMTTRWLNYLERFNDRSRAVTKSSAGTNAISEESRLLLEEENRARYFLFGTKKNSSNDALGKRFDKGLLKDRERMKRRKIETERHRGEMGMEKDDLEQRAVLEDALADTNLDFEEDDEKGRKTDDAFSDDSSYDEDELAMKVKPIDEMKINLLTYTSIEGSQPQLILEDMKPSYVVLYDAEPSFIRALEIYASSFPTPKMDQNRLRVFFLLFEESSEEKLFVSSLEREQNAFEKLIQHKKSMALPLQMMGATTTQEMQQAMSGAVSSYCGGKYPLSVDTRTGQGKRNPNAEKRDVAVDVREFRSALPSILHQGGLRLAPVTLYVGDFVLSSVHCIERKSISDLYGSFASGRLYTQAEAMCKHYKCACLMIEFDPMKVFALQSSADIGSEIRTDSICSKMALLAMHFPKLRILWCRGPHETLKLFKSLKKNHEEVDVEKAMEIGSNESVDGLLISQNKDGGPDSGNEINEVARDLLLRLPGINVSNARTIMSECESIKELAGKSRDDLKRLLGPITGQKLYAFFRQKVNV